MCRNIRTLHNFEPPATRDEVHAAAVQYVRKISGTTEAVAGQPGTPSTRRWPRSRRPPARLLESLTTSAPPKNREVEAAKARARAEVRYARG